MPVFFQDWWLDVVCGAARWDVFLVKDSEDQIRLVLPYMVKTLYGFKISSQPPLTPFLGAKIVDPEQPLKLARLHRYKSELLDQLSSQISSKGFIYFNQLFPPDFTNWKPLYTNNFYQTTFYRYIIRDIKEKDQVRKAFGSSKKNKINKFKKSTNEIVVTEDAAMMHDLIQNSFIKNDARAGFSKQLYLNLDAAICRHGHRKIFVAKDSEENILAAIYLLVDHDRAYLLNTGMDYQRKDSTAVTALIWHGIQYASLYVDTFDFCGSMIRPISDFFEDFGGEAEPYFRIYKYKNRLVKSIFAISGN